MLNEKKTKGGSLDIIILGSGTLSSLPWRNPSGYFLQNGNRRAIMDMGPGILRRISQAGINVTDIDTVFLSHFHPDHCADLIPFLLSRFLADPDCNSRLQVVGPAGLSDWFEYTVRDQGRWLERRPLLLEPGESGLDWAEYRIRAFPTGHTSAAVAFRFDGEISFFYSGDTPFSEPLMDWLKGCRYGILECSFPETREQAAHLSARQAGLFAARVGLERVYLTHIYPENDTIDLALRVARYFGGQVVVTEDHLFIRLGREL